MESFRVAHNPISSFYIQIYDPEFPNNKLIELLNKYPEPINLELKAVSLTAKSHIVVNSYLVFPQKYNGMSLDIKYLYYTILTELAYINMANNFNFRPDIEIQIRNVTDRKKYITAVKKYISKYH